MKRLYEGAERLGITLGQEQLGRFEIYYRELVEWNRRINLTAITDYEEVQVKHFLDSLTIIPYIEKTRNILRVIDIGTGAGLPGIPLKIALPEIRLTLLEATVKKVRFLEDLVGKLELKGIETVTGRAEEISHDRKYREQYDLALSRAVAALPTIVELAMPFCVQSGMFIAQKRGDIEEEIRQSSRAINETGGRLREVVPLEIEGAGDGRKLVIIDKVKPTPDKYPRRSGIPAKRPDKFLGFFIFPYPAAI
jgi:16S rRNA (guanine527-N7)-methyltransferase